MDYFSKTNHKLIDNGSIITATSSSENENGFGNISIESTCQQTHIWKFEISNNRDGSGIYIGIVEDGHLDLNKYKLFAENGYGYGLCSDGDIYSAISNEEYHKMGNAKQKYKKNDIVLMRLDLKNKILSFIINNHKAIKIKKIKINHKIKYKMAVFLWESGDSIKLLNHYKEKDNEKNKNESKQEIMTEKIKDIKNIKMKQQNKNKLNEIDKYKNLYSRKCDDNKRLENELKENKLKQKKYKSENDKLREEIEKLKKENQLKRENDKKSIKTLKSKLIMKEKENKQNMTDQQKMEEKVNELNIEIEGIRNNYDELKKETDLKLIESQNKIKRLQKDKRALKHKLDEITQVNIGQETKTLILQKENEILRNNRDEIQRIRLEQQTQIEALQNVINRFKKQIEQNKGKMVTNQYKLDEITQVNLSQQKTILKLQSLLNDKTEEEQKNDNGNNNNNDDIDINKGLKKILIDLNDEIEAFKHDINQRKLQEIYNKSPTEIIRTDSGINKRINGYGVDIENIISSSQSVNKYIMDIRSYMKTISIPDINEYKQWNLEQIIAWIISLDDGKYWSVSDKIRQGFIKDNILSGDLLPEITRSDLSNPPFNINDFKMKRDLEEHFKSLTDNEGDKTGGYYR